MKYIPFWDRVQKLLKAHRISRKNFAEHIGMSVNTLQSWMRYNRLPDVNSGYRMAKALGVSPDYLVLGKDRENTEQRLKVLAARKAAEKINKLLAQIQKETGIIKGIPPQGRR